MSFLRCKDFCGTCSLFALISRFLLIGRKKLESGGLVCFPEDPVVEGYTTSPFISIKDGMVNGNSYCSGIRKRQFPTRSSKSQFKCISIEKEKVDLSGQAPCLPQPL